MLKKTFYFFSAILLIVTACRKADNGELVEQETEPLFSYEAKGDSTVYGLACDGCDEEKLVILFPETGQDPDTFSVTEAFKARRVLGRPTVGDKMAVLLDKNDPKKVVVAINLNALVGEWVYDVMPEFRRQIDEEILRKLSEEDRAKIDSLRNSYMVPREYGIVMKADNTAMSAGRVQRTNSLEGESPVVYPEVKRYSEWHVFNGKLILTISSRMNAALKKDTEKAKVINDTADIVLLRRDTLALKFGDKIQGYRLKPDTLSDRN